MKRCAERYETRESWEIEPTDHSRMPTERFEFLKWSKIFFKYFKCI